MPTTFASNPGLARPGLTTPGRPGLPGIIPPPPPFDSLPVLPPFTTGQKNDVRTEMNLGNLGWTDISSFVLETSDQADSRGKPDESTASTPGNLTLTLNNADGRFFDGNPLGPYYGQLGRNTPVRVSVPEGAVYCRIRDDSTSFVAAPPGISNAGDLDIRMDVTLDNWRSPQQLVAKWGASGQFSYQVALSQGGTLVFTYSTTGSNTLVVGSLLPVPVPAGRRQLLRVTFNHITGGVDFYHAPVQSLGSMTTRSPSWVHDSGLAATPGTVFASTTGLLIGWNNRNTASSSPGPLGKLHAFEFRTGTVPQHVGTSPALLSAVNGGAMAWVANPGAGAKVLIAVWTTTAETITSVQDNGTTPTTYVLDKTVVNGTSVTSIYRGDSIKLPGSGAYTVTVTGTGGAIVVASAQAYAGVAAGAPSGTIGNSNSATGTGTAVGTGGVTPVSSTAMFFAAFSDASALAAESITLTGVSFNQVGVQTNGSTSIAGGAADRMDSGGTGTAGCSWTLGDSVAWAGCIVVYGGASGALQANPDFTAQAAGSTSLTDGKGNLWLLNGTAVCTDRHYRFWGETSAFPTTWNSRGTQVEVALQGSGILRRLTQAAQQQPLASALRRAWPALPDLIAYWPCEDGNNTSTSFGASTAIPPAFAPGIPGVPIGTYSGQPQFAAAANFQASLPIPTLNGSTWSFAIPGNHAADVANVLRFLLFVPPAGEAATFTGGVTQDVPLVDLHTSGTIAKLSIMLQGGSQAGGANTPIQTNLIFVAFNAAGSQIGSLSVPPLAVQGIPLWVSVEAVQSGGNVSVSIGAQIIGESFVYHSTGTVSAATIGNATTIVVDPGGTLTDTAVGQITYQRVLHDMSANQFGLPISAWIGETAGNRFSRLCTEQNIPARFRGNLNDTQPMGAQTELDVISLLQECVDADRGMWWEPPFVLALGYRCLNDLLNQAPVAQVPYASGQLAAGAVASNEDDQFTINDATVVNTYTGGQSERVVTQGPLSNQAPPNGVGPYQSQPQVNVANDWQTADEAGWITWVGTAPDLRFPQIPFHMSRLGTAAFFALQEADVGDRLQIVTPPANGAAPANTAQPSWLAPSSQTSYAKGGIDVLVNNLATTLNVKKYDIGITGVPTTPYLCAQADDPVHGRVGHANSQVLGPMTPGQTTMAVTSPVDAFHVSTDPWTSLASDYPFDLVVSGEQMTATGISGGPAANDIGSDSANPPQNPVTPGASGSVIYGSVVNPTNSTAFTPNGATTFSQNVSDATNARAYGTFRSTATTTAGTPVTLGASAPAVAGHIEAAEVIAAGGAITEDASSPAGVSTTAAQTLTTASFTPPANSLIVAMAAVNGTISSISGGPGAGWELLANDGSGNCYVWAQWAGPAPSASTVTVNWTGANGGALTVKVLTSAAAGDACQVFTVVRAQNGIAKAQAAGTKVDLYTPPVLSL